MAGVNLDSLSIFGVAIVALTSLGLLLTQSSLWSILFLAAQYLGVFILVGTQWPLQLALSKLVAGWIATAVLWMIIVSLRREEANNIAGSRRPGWLPEISLTYASTNSARLFRLLAAILVALAMFSISPAVTNWVPGIGIEATLGSLILIGLGLLHLGLTTHPLRVVFGLLTVLSGFEILYAAVEVSALVAGLLAAVTMGLALLGAYFLLSTGMEETK